MTSQFDNNQPHSKLEAMQSIGASSSSCATKNNNVAVKIYNTKGVLYDTGVIVTHVSHLSNLLDKNGTLMLCESKLIGAPVLMAQSKDYNAFLGRFKKEEIFIKDNALDTDRRCYLKVLRDSDCDGGDCLPCYCFNDLNGHTSTLDGFSENELLRTLAFMHVQNLSPEVFSNFQNSSSSVEQVEQIDHQACLTNFSGGQELSNSKSSTDNFNSADLGSARVMNEFVIFFAIGGLITGLITNTLIKIFEEIKVSLAVKSIIKELNSFDLSLSGKNEAFNKLVDREDIQKEIGCKLNFSKSFMESKNSFLKTSRYFNKILPKHKPFKKFILNSFSKLEEKFNIFGLKKVEEITREFLEDFEESNNECNNADECDNDSIDSSIEYSEYEVDMDSNLLTFNTILF